GPPRGRSARARPCAPVYREAAPRSPGIRRPAARIRSADPAISSSLATHALLLSSYTGPAAQGDQKLADALFWHRLQFAFTAVYHYIFPQLTMGLAFLIVLMKWRALRTGEPHWNDAARFWIRIFGLNFAVGVVTGVPMEFQFGTNWAAF